MLFKFYCLYHTKIKTMYKTPNRIKMIIPKQLTSRHNRNSVTLTHFISSMLSATPNSKKPDFLCYLWSSLLKAELLPST